MSHNSVQIMVMALEFYAHMRGTAGPHYDNGHQASLALDRTKDCMHPIAVALRPHLKFIEATGKYTCGEHSQRKAATEEAEAGIRVWQAMTAEGKQSVTSAAA